MHGSTGKPKATTSSFSQRRGSFGRSTVRDRLDILAAHYGTTKAGKRRPSAKPEPQHASPAQQIQPPPESKPVQSSVSNETERKMAAGRVMRLEQETLARRKPRPKLTVAEKIQLEKRKNKPARPTLSEQLASIGTGAADLTSSLRKQHGIQEPSIDALGTFPALEFSVGRLNCSLCSPITFYRDKCVYVFHHPFQPTEITMEMHYRDMSQVVFNERQKMFQFKIPHALFHYGDDYQAENSQHFVSVRFSSELDCVTFKAQVFQPYIKLSTR